MAINLKIITPTKVLKEISTDMVVAPGAEGEVGLLPGHSPYLLNLKSGYVRIFNKESEAEKVFIMSGVCQIENDECTILTEHAPNLAKTNKEEISKKLSELKSQVANNHKTGEGDLEKLLSEIEAYNNLQAEIN